MTDEIQAWSEIASNAATIIAIALGGVWGYSRFVRRRESHPKATIEHHVSFVQLSGQKLLIRVGIHVQNIGDMLLNWNEGLVQLQQVSPCADHILNWVVSAIGDEAKNETEAPWPVIGNRSLTGRTHHLEPGESDEVYCDFIVSTPVTTVLVYSHIENETKDGLGWNDCTTHQVPRMNGETIMDEPHENLVRVFGEIGQPSEPIPPSPKRQGPPRSPAAPQPSTRPTPPPRPPTPSPTPSPQGPPRQPPPPPPPAPRSKR